jgi:hypothetical protein
MATDVDDLGVSDWYFANAAQMQQGYNDFKRKWSNRQLTDNWRRLSANVFGSTASSGSDTAVTETPSDMQVDENGLPTEESLIALLPNTPAKRATANEHIQRAYMDLGNAYIKELEDYAHALATYDTLNKRFPDHKFKAEELYKRYQVALKQNQILKAQTYSQQLMREYSNTQWATLVRPSEDGKGLEQLNNTNSGAYYQETYDLLVNHQYTEVLQHLQVAKTNFSNSKYNGHFRILEATAYAGSANYPVADSLLTNYLSSAQPDSMREWANAILKYIAPYRPAGAKPAAVTSVATTDKGSKADTSKSASAAPASPLPTPKGSAFVYQSHEEHYFVLVFPAMDAKATGLKTAFADFNAAKLSSQHLNINLEMLQPPQGCVVVRSFNSSPEARYYLTLINAKPELFKDYKAGEYQFFVISASNYLRLLANKNLSAYMTFYSANYK